MKQATKFTPVEKLFISASFSDTVANPYDNQLVFALLAKLVPLLVEHDIGLVFGGHPTTIPLIYQILADLEVENYRADLYQLAHFKAKAELLPEVMDEKVFRTHLVGPERILSADELNDALGEMREKMVATSQAAVFLGGKEQGFTGKRPGIEDEFARFTAAKQHGHCYLIGFLGGTAARLVKQAKQGRLKLVNGLLPQEREQLFSGANLDEIVALIVSDLI